MKKEYEEVEIELSDKEIVAIALEAHKRDITFNRMCNIILEEAIEELEKRERKGRKPVKKVKGRSRPAKKRVSKARVSGLDIV